MKVLIVSSLFAVLTTSSASVSSAVAWPGARVLHGQPTSILKSVLPPQTKVFGFSTTQYIKPVPQPFVLQPQVHYQVPQLTHFAPVSHTPFFPIAGGSYYPGSVFYPPFPIAPSVPGIPITPSFPGPANEIPSFPPQGIPSFPSQEKPNVPTQQPSGDTDTSVVDSADFPHQDDQTKEQDQPQEQSPSTEAPQQEQSSTQSPPSGNFPFPSFPQGGEPSFPSFPQFPQGSIPQFPQGIGEGPPFPSFPQFPQGDGQPAFPSLPQFPSGAPPQFPQLPQFPSNPSFPQSPTPSFPQSPTPSFPQSPTPTPPSSFPGSADGDKGLNDEDTISVESA